MSVTSVHFVTGEDKERNLNQIERLVHSHTLRKAESLCKLLRYLAEHALTQPDTPLKEYQIATEVFGRPENFDPQADSAIRVQAGRLRLKLLDYYSHEGSGDTIVVEMPNGSYVLNFHDREAPAAAGLPLQTPSRFPVLVTTGVARKRRRWWVIASAVISLLLIGALVTIGILYADLSSER